MHKGCKVLILSALFLPFSAAFAKQKAEWILEQKHHDFGVCRVYIANDAIKIVNSARGFILVAAAPKWKVSIYRPKERICYNTDMQGLSRFSVFGPIAWSRQERIARLPVSTEKVGDLTLSKYLVSDGKTQVWKIDDIKSQLEVETIYQQYFQLPVIGAIYRCTPAKVIAEKNKDVASAWLGKGLNNIADWFTTKSCDKTVYNPRDFEYPQGMRSVPTQSDVLVGADSAREFGDLIDSMGIDEKRKR